MEQSIFDRLVVALATGVNRRRGLAGAFGVALGSRAIDAAAGNGERAEKPTGAENGKAPGNREGRRRTGVEGPCGDGSHKDNACTKDKQCCTGFCKKKLKNKDGKGRCRCIRRGKPCKPSQTCCTGACAGGICGTKSCIAPGAPCGKGDSCCGGNVCTSGTCQPAGPAPVPTGEACAPATDTCENADASCIAYDSDDPAGTYCLLPTGKTCSGDKECYSQDCTGNVCLAIVCDVCANPLTCTYQSLDAAIAGTPDKGRIRIDAGTWDSPTTMLLPKSLRFEACGGVSGVIIQGYGSNFCLFDVTDNTSITVKNIEFQHLNAIGDLCANSVASWATRPAMTVIGCTFPSTTNIAAISAYGPIDITVTDSTFDGTGVEVLVDAGGSPSTLSFSRTTHSNMTSAYAFNIENDVVLTLTDCVVSNIDITSVGPITAASIAATAITSVVLAGTTEVTNNSASAGGGVVLDVTSGSLTFTMTDSSSITGNSAPQASGLMVVKRGSVSPVVSGTSTRISGNTGAPDQCAISPNGLQNWVGVPDCTSF